MRDYSDGARISVDELATRRWFYLYRYFGADGALLYVGVTGDPYRRWVEHRRRSPWADDVAEVAVERYAYEDLAYAQERAVIKSERPLHNVKSTDSHDRALVLRLRPQLSDPELSQSSESHELTDGLTDGEVTPPERATATSVTRASRNRR